MSPTSTATAATTCSWPGPTRFGIVLTGQKGQRSSRCEPRVEPDRGAASDLAAGDLNGDGRPTWS